ncbi:SRPBCC domain-containing protein [Niveibacterium sp. SC-1]|uniref:SRPBCC domain-containing protein n=1 Tax=Niveibacterium sp. SC-1 TaxID=3135646 RepID=UPI00311FF84F
MQQIETEIAIDAPPERVWAILTDFASYPEWNPMLPAIRGEAVEGRQLLVRYAGDKGPRDLWAKVSRSESQRSLRWHGNVVFAGLVVAEQRFRLRKRSNGNTRLYQTIYFAGPLAPLLGHRLRTAAMDGAVSMNLALKRRVEAAG